MSYKLTIIQKPTYLHAIVTGLNNKENVALYLEGIRYECRARCCSRLLIEEHLEGPRLSLMNVFDIVEEKSRREMGYFDAIAFVDVNAEGDSARFAETVAVNRFLPVKVFATVSDAEQWLLGKDRAAINRTQIA